MTSPIFKGEEIKRLLNQRSPILMVDVLYEADETKAVAGLTVGAECMFCQDGKLTEPGLIEHIAQSASAFVSYKANINSPEADALLGYIGEVKKLKINGPLPAVGVEVRTTITIQSEVMGITLFTAEAKVNDCIVASCQMKLSV